MPTEPLDLHSVKAIEYVVAALYLALFVPFWRYVQGRMPARAAVPVRLPARAGWFALPDGVALHPGHAWLRGEDAEVTVGLDDFAHRLVGPLTGVRLPRHGTTLRQGEVAWTLEAGGKGVDMLAPAGGTVSEVNPLAVLQPETLHRDPYGVGWLFKLRPHDLSRERKQLLAGEPARLLLDHAAETLRRRMTPALGALAADGGMPVHGFARELSPEHWDALAREAFMTQDETERRVA